MDIKYPACRLIIFTRCRRRSNSSCGPSASGRAPPCRQFRFVVPVSAFPCVFCRQSCRPAALILPSLARSPIRLPLAVLELLRPAPSWPAPGTAQADSRRAVSWMSVFLSPVSPSSTSWLPYHKCDMVCLSGSSGRFFEVAHYLNAYLKINFSFPDCPPVTTGTLPVRLGNTEITWEKPVLSGTYTVGFIDMEIKTTRSRLFSVSPDREDDFNFGWTQEVSGRTAQHLIEVKPKITSLGEVIRQIRLYETHCPSGRFYVCSPDARFESALKSQRIGFIKAEV
jgi:hypothetical protein